MPSLSLCPRAALINLAFVSGACSSAVSAEDTSSLAAGSAPLTLPVGTDCRAMQCCDSSTDGVVAGAVGRLWARWSCGPAFAAAWLAGFLAVSRLQCQGETA